MLEDLLSLVEGLSSEDLASEVLAFLLREKHYAPVQRLFFDYVLQDGRAQSTLERKLEVETRVRYGEFGVPDILIIGDDTVLLVENKFHAPYSGGDQLWRYAQLLCSYRDFSGLSRKTMALLTTAGRAPFYLAEAVKDFSRQDRGIKDHTSLTAALDKMGIQLRIARWQDVLRLFESGDPLLTSLSSFVNTSFIREVKLMDIDIATLQSEAFPTALQKLLQAVMTTRDRVHELGVDARKYKFTQSIDVYGFYVNLKNCDAWFGYIRQLWTKVQPPTPLFLQFRPEWVRDNLYSDGTHRPRLLERLVAEETFGFVKSYPVTSLNEIDALAQSLCADFHFIEALLSGDKG